MKKTLLSAIILLVFACMANAQFYDSGSGLIQCPSAEMHKDATFSITNNYLNSHQTPKWGWGYDTFGYGFAFTFWSRLEIGYVCTIFDGKRRPNPSERDKIMFNQDRHFTAKFQFVKEGEFGLTWLPAIAAGVSDPVTGAHTGQYIGSDVTKGNGYFNRMYVVATKHFRTQWGEVGTTLGYQYNLRRDFHYNAPCAAVTWEPVWVQNLFLQDKFRVVAEFDARTFNAGCILSLWMDHFDMMIELQNMKWVSGGLRYKVVLK